MKSPLSHRQEIPFFYNKSKVEFQKDSYERYHDMILRHTALHLADELWVAYPMQPVLDFGKEYIENNNPRSILEIGSGVGRWIADLAQTHPQSKCWGVDYSYQMLKRANDFWVKGINLHLDLSHKGFSNSLQIEGSNLSNLNFGLAKASELPFDDNSQDVVCSSFLIDRLEDPVKGIIEMNRVLKPGGLLIMITPLNFENSDHWSSFHPSSKLLQFLAEMTLECLECQEDMIIQEPLDARGNCVIWKCLSIIAQKR